MQLRVLALDYDGTIAQDGVLDPEGDYRTLEALPGVRMLGGLSTPLSQDRRCRRARASIGELCKRC
ncbi:MAG TPA: hypothetical protein VLK82_02310 [Candidatus Tectomicrobia bacterium]|nr:hypothetical protein [Candidatus Tectomicrobia bacterium]